MDFLISLGKNRIFWTTLAAWVFTQTLKVIFGVAREKRFNFKWFVGSGGMPSSHAAGVTALSTSVGFECGFDSPLYAATLIFALIVMFDAQGVRHATGRQAEILNRIMEDIYYKQRIKEERLKELVGHTPVEVFIGAAIGVLMAVLFRGF
jgi:acid phosphatase family membrane protein YuiD